VVSSAAVIMVAVFSIFVTLSAIEYKMLGVGMSLAIIIDATIVRGVLLPAVMALLGRYTWALPGWLPGGKAEAVPEQTRGPRPAVRVAAPAPTEDTTVGTPRSRG
jgi:RND superfamily putative drug exporter